MLNRLIVRTVSKLECIENYDRFLFVGPHPDDIEIGAGAFIAKLSSMGKKICFLICTDGRYGTSEILSEEDTNKLSSKRKEEAIASASILGVSDVRFLDLSDGGLYQYEDLEYGILECICDFQADIVFAPDIDTGAECHIDHLNAGKAVKTSAYISSNPGIMRKYCLDAAPVSAIAFYMTARPNLYVKTGEHFNTQLHVLSECFPSQFPAKSDGLKSLILYLKVRSFSFGLRCFSLHGEGFRVLNYTQMHCLPEYGL